MYRPESGRFLVKAAVAMLIPRIKDCLVLSLSGISNHSLLHTNAKMNLAKHLWHAWLLEKCVKIHGTTFGPVYPTAE